MVYYIKLKYMEDINDIEVWKQIKDYEYYQVSSFGNIKNINTQKILKLSRILLKNLKTSMSTKV